MITEPFIWTPELASIKYIQFPIQICLNPPLPQKQKEKRLIFYPVRPEAMQIIPLLLQCCCFFLVCDQKNMLAGICIQFTPNVSIASAL